MFYSSIICEKNLLLDYCTSIIIITLMIHHNENSVDVDLSLLYIIAFLVCLLACLFDSSIHFSLMIDDSNSFSRSELSSHISYVIAFWILKQSAVLSLSLFRNRIGTGVGCGMLSDSWCPTFYLRTGDGLPSELRI